MNTGWISEDEYRKLIEGHDVSEPLFKLMDIRNTITQYGAVRVEYRVQTIPVIQHIDRDDLLNLAATVI